MRFRSTVLRLLLFSSLAAACTAEAVDEVASEDDAPAPEAQASTSITWPLIGTGDTGDLVAAAQFLLSARGQTTVADGSFGSGTEAAVIAFQRAQRLTADGLISPRRRKPSMVGVVWRASIGMSGRNGET